MAEIKLQFSADITLPLEIALVQRWGFRVHTKRNQTGKYITFSKDVIPRNRRETNPDMLDEVTKTLLLRKINKIVDFYENPELCVRSIRARINNLAMTQAPDERLFIQKWAQEHVTEDQ